MNDKESYQILMSLLPQSLNDNEAKEKCRNFDGDWPRQFLFRLVYFHEQHFTNPELLRILKIWLDISIG